MNSKAVQFLEAHQSGERSTFVDDAKWRQENASWLRRSQRCCREAGSQPSVCEQDSFRQGKLLVQDNLRD